MGTGVFNLFFLCVLVFSISPSLSASDNSPKTRFISLPVKINPTTHQYYTQIGIGTPRHNINFAIDLSAKFLWYDCDTHYNSSSYSNVNCALPKCPPGAFCFSCDGSPRKPGCTNETCGFEVVNPFADTLLGSYMGQDFLFLQQTKLPRNFVSVCTDTDGITNPALRKALLVGLDKGIKGILGLSRFTTTRLTLPYQISSTFNVPPKFTLCLPSQANKKGQLFIGATPSFSSTVSQVGFASFNDEEYFIGVNSITVDGKPVKFATSLLSPDEKGNGGTKISTASPYTALHHSIYIPFVRDFVNAAEARNIKRVKKLHSFGACFDANTIADREAVPAINLVIDGRFGKLNYNISGHNPLVKMRKGVLCLAFVDAGKFASIAIVLGGHQLENRILEFDLSTSILSFSSSLLLQNKTCSDSSSL